MKAKILKALNGSIKKWEGIAAGTGKDFGPRNCPLCKMFWKSSDDWISGVSCYGCPVLEATGRHACNATPYQDWADLETNTATTPKAKKAALAELNFLKSLLPKSK